MGIEGTIVKVLVASILACSLTLFASASPHSSDCLKNPFATGCRGISAKRSVLPSWPQLDKDPATSDLYHLLAAPMQTAAWPPAFRLSNQQEMAQLKMQQLMNAVELLVEVTSRLVSLSPMEQQQLAAPAGRRLCRELYSLEDASELQKRPVISSSHRQAAE